MPLSLKTSHRYVQDFFTNTRFVPSRKTVWSRSGTIDVFEMGEGDPILVLPGMAGGANLLLPFVNELAENYRVFWFDWAGEGHSFALEALRIKDHPTRLLSDVLDSLPVKSVSVFGISYGGCVALDLAKHGHPGIRHLILTGTPDRLEHAWASRLVHRVLTRVPLSSDSAFLNQFFRILLGESVRDPDLEDFVANCIWQTDQALMARRLDWLLDFDLSQELTDIQIPTTVLTGDRDIVVPPVCQERLANRLPNADMHMIANAGHLGFLSHSKQYLRLLQKTLSQPCSYV
ncbi:MAG: hypothetical protein RJA81_2160 [Planctomycetota bacterium]